MQELQLQLNDLLNTVVSALETEQNGKLPDSLWFYRNAQSQLSDLLQTGLHALRQIIPPRTCNTYSDDDVAVACGISLSLEQEEPEFDSDESIQLMEEMLNSMSRTYSLHIKMLQEELSLLQGPGQNGHRAGLVLDSPAVCRFTTPKHASPSFTFDSSQDVILPPYGSQPWTAQTPNPSNEPCLVPGQVKSDTVRQLDQHQHNLGYRTSVPEADQQQPAIYQLQAGNGELVTEDSTEQDPLERDMKRQCVRPGQGSLDDVAGLDDLKMELRQAVLLPRQLPHLFTGLRAPPRTFLFYGPPGTGKTLLVDKVAAEGGLSLLRLPPSAVLSKWSGDSEKAVRAAFKAAAASQPCALFIDEIDSLAPSRGGSDDAASRRLLTELLLQLNDLLAPCSSASQVYVFAATNRLQDCDAALLRRFHRRMCVPLPDAAARRDFFKLQLSLPEMEHQLGDLNNIDNAHTAKLIQATEGYSCSDLAAVCKEAAMVAVTEIMSQHYTTLMSFTRLKPQQVGNQQGAAQMATDGFDVASIKLRKLTLSDFTAALSKIRPAAHDQEQAAKE